MYDGGLVSVVWDCVGYFMWFKWVKAGVEDNGCDNGANGIKGVHLHVVYRVAYVCSDRLLQCIQASLVVVPSAGYEGFVDEFGNVRCDDSCCCCRVYGTPGCMRAMSGGR